MPPLSCCYCYTATPSAAALLYCNARNSSRSRAVLPLLLHYSYYYSYHYDCYYDYDDLLLTSAN